MENETIMIDGVRYYADRPNSCRGCFFWKNRKAGCSLKKENCYYHPDFKYRRCLYSICPYPEAYEQFIAREDHMDLLKKYNVYCHEHMTLLLEILRNEAGFCSRKVLTEGLQQDLYDFIIKKTKVFVFDQLTDLLAETSWMSV